MKTIEVESTNKQGRESYLHRRAHRRSAQPGGPGADATTVVFVADDGYTAEIALADVMACTNCIVSFREKGGFSTVLPGYPGNLQVKGVIEIQVK